MSNTEPPGTSAAFLSGFALRASECETGLATTHGSLGDGGISGPTTLFSDLRCAAPSAGGPLAREAGPSWEPRGCGASAGGFVSESPGRLRLRITCRTGQTRRALLVRGVPGRWLMSPGERGAGGGPRTLPPPRPVGPGPNLHVLSRLHRTACCPARSAAPAAGGSGRVWASALGCHVRVLPGTPAFPLISERGPRSPINVSWTHHSQRRRFIASPLMTDNKVYYSD